MTNTTHETATITTHAKRAIELYLHGLAVYAAYPERRTAEQMYEIRRVSEAFSEADHVAYNSNEAQRQWWISAHNAFCDVTTRAGEAILPTFDEKPGFSPHAINYPHGSLLQGASHGQLDQLPNGLIGKDGDILTDCKDSETEGPPAVTAIATRGDHQPSVKAFTENNHGAANAFAQPSQKTTAEISKGIEDLKFGSSFEELEKSKKNTLDANETTESYMKADRSTPTAHASLDGRLNAMMQGSTFKELNDAKSAVKTHLDAAVFFCIATRDGLNMQEILNEHMKRVLLETDPEIRSHRLEDCVRNVTFVLDETKARLNQTKAALFCAQMERESLDRKIDVAQMDFDEERGKRKEAQYLLAIAADKAETTMREKHRFKKELIILRTELSRKTAQ